MKKILLLGALFAAAAAFMAGCAHKSSASDAAAESDSTATTVAHPDWSRNAVIYEVNLRQYSDSGNLAGFEAQLPRLRDLGVDILWFMPVHPISATDRKGTLGSYYAVQDYKAFNPEFGTFEQFRDLVAKAHEMGFKVLIDWVPNHTGTDNVWVEAHPDWYALNDKGEKYGPYDWTDVYKLDYSNPEMRAAMIDALRFWLTEADVDGFRCDVAGEVPVDFWDEARPQLEQARPQGLFMLAEASYPPLQRHAFDMGYNWPMKDLFNAIAATAGQRTFIDRRNGATEVAALPVRHAVDIDSLLAAQAAEYPAGTYMMNMVTNHDLNSWEGTEFERLGNLTDAFAVLSYTLPGMPLIYTGQETGLNRALEFFEKDTAPQWEPRNEYFDFYRRLNALKHDQPALRAGDQGAPVVSYPTTSDDLYIFSRTDDATGRTVTVFTNLGAAPAEISYTGAAPEAAGTTVNYMTGAEEAYPAALNPGEYRIYVNS